MLFGDSPSRTVVVSAGVVGGGGGGGYQSVASLEDTVASTSSGPPMVPGLAAGIPAAALAAAGAVGVTTGTMSAVPAGSERPVARSLKGCDGCSCDTEAGSVMEWVGAGRGEYIMGTTYKFVGSGVGDHNAVEERERIAPCWAVVGGVAFLGLAIVAAVLLWTGVAATTTMKSMMVATTLEPFHCDEEFGNWQIAWTIAKKAYCCDRYQRGCTAGAPPQDFDFDCEAGAENWQLDWSDIKKNWCCTHRQKGCSETCNAKGCGDLCNHDVGGGPGSEQKSCRERVSWAKDHSRLVPSQTLTDAIELINGECACQCACTEADFVPQGARGDCLLWGDPHINTFDNAAFSFYGEGEVWVVKNPKVHIQARYLATPFTNGLAATDTLAVGGPFLMGHVLKIGPLSSGSITWDDKPILTDFPSKFDASGLGALAYDDQGDVVEREHSQLDRHIVHATLPEGVRLQVMRWENHINVLIEMQQTQDGQDGHCGNFNGNAADDSHDQVVARLGNSVPQSECMFRNYLQPKPGKQLTLDDCPEDKRSSAEAACKQVQPDMDVDILAGCTFDVCFADHHYAQQDGIY